MMINSTVIFSLVSMLGFGGAVILLALRFKRAGLGPGLTVPLFMALLLYGFIVTSNFLEHSGITEFFDPFEDVAEIVFILILLFFVHNLRRQKSFRIIRNQEIWLRSAMASIADGVITTDQQGGILQMNPAMEKLTGRTQDQALGKDVSSFPGFIIQKQSEIVTYHPFKAVMEGKPLRNLPKRVYLVASDGRQIPVSDRTAPIRGPDGEILGYVGVFRDMTDYDALTEQLAHSQKMEAIGQLSGGIAHDMNNMLGGIMGAAEVIRNRMARKGNTDHDKLLSIILGAAENARDLTANLLAFSRKNKLFSTPVSISEVIEKTGDLARRTIDKRVDLAIFCSSKSPMVVGESAQLQNAILNLVINGCDAMPQGGTITIECSSLFLDKAACSKSGFDIEPGPYAAVAVRDTGTGIPPENRSRVFEPFFTTKAEGKGTGLGLAAVCQTIIRHHGALVLETTLGKGSSFTIYLPEADPVLMEQEAEPSGSSPFDKTLLLIEDEKMILSSTQMMLEDMGFSIFTAESGEKGVKLYKEHREKIDLVILDMVMPGMTGLETFSVLRAINEKIRVVFISGLEQADRLPESAAGFVRKPFKRSELSGAIIEALSPRHLSSGAGSGTCSDPAASPQEQAS